MKTITAIIILELIIFNIFLLSWNTGYDLGVEVGKAESELTSNGCKLYHNGVRQ